MNALKSRRRFRGARPRIPLLLCAVAAILSYCFFSFKSRSMSPSAFLLCLSCGSLCAYLSGISLMIDQQSRWPTSNVNASLLSPLKARHFSIQVCSDISLSLLSLSYASPAAGFGLRDMVIFDDALVAFPLALRQHSFRQLTCCWTSSAF